MWSLTLQRVRRTGGPENFQSSVKKDFFNSIGTKRTCRRSYFVSAVAGLTDQARMRPNRCKQLSEIFGIVAPAIDVFGALIALLALSTCTCVSCTGADNNPATLLHRPATLLVADNLS